MKKIILGLILLTGLFSCSKETNIYPKDTKKDSVWLVYSCEITGRLISYDTTTLQHIGYHYQIVPPGNSYYYVPFNCYDGYNQNEIILYDSIDFNLPLVYQPYEVKNKKSFHYEITSNVIKKIPYIYQPDREFYGGVPDTIGTKVNKTIFRFKLKL